MVGHGKKPGSYSKRNGEPLESSDPGVIRSISGFNRITSASVWKETAGKPADGRARRAVMRSETAVVQTE